MRLSTPFSLLTASLACSIVLGAPIVVHSGSGASRLVSRSDIEAAAADLGKLTESSSATQIEIDLANAVASVAKNAAADLKDAAGALRARVDGEEDASLFGDLSSLLESSHASSEVSVEQSLLEAVDNVAKNAAADIKDAAGGLRARVDGEEEASLFGDVSSLLKSSHASSEASVEQSLIEAVANVAKNAASDLKDAAGALKTRRRWSSRLQ